jgi:hypothetical protein
MDTPVYAAVSETVESLRMHPKVKVSYVILLYSMRQEESDIFCKTVLYDRTTTYSPSHFVSVQKKYMLLSNFNPARTFLI